MQFLKILHKAIPMKGIVSWNNSMSISLVSGGLYQSYLKYGQFQNTLLHWKKRIERQNGSNKVVEQNGKNRIEGQNGKNRIEGQNGINRIEERNGADFPFYYCICAITTSMR